MLIAELLKLEKMFAISEKTMKLFVCAAFCLWCVLAKLTFNPKLTLCLVLEIPIDHIKIIVNIIL